MTGQNVKEVRCSLLHIHNPKNSSLKKKSWKEGGADCVQSANLLFYIKTEAIE